MKFPLIYNKACNTFLRTILKPFSSVLSPKLKFPVNGSFKVRGRAVPPFTIITNPTSYFSKKLFWDNVEGFEYYNVRIFCELIKRSSVFFDIGANIGYYSLLGTAIRGKELDVYAFEPMPSAFGFLEQNIKVNRYTNIRPVRCALSNAKGTARFFSIVNPKFSDFPQLTGDGGLNVTHSGSRSKVSFDVDTDTLDNFAESRLSGKFIDLIKLDTEANEHYVLMGATHVLSKHRPIIQCEILKNQIENDLEQILSQHGYSYFRATPMGLKRVTTFINNPTDFCDYYLVPREKEFMIQQFLS